MPLKKPLSTPVLNIICPSLFHRFTSGKKTGGGGVGGKQITLLATSSLHSRASLDNYC